MSTTPIRVLLVDDHAVMRAGFRMILEAAGGIEVVGEASDGAEAVARASVLLPDVVCMDVQMPVMDGLEATRRIVAEPDSTAAVVIVTTFDRDDYLFQALSAGASGFLLKNAGPEDLVSAVRVAAAGDALLAPEVTRRVIARFAGTDAAADAGRSGAADTSAQADLRQPSADAGPWPSARAGTARPDPGAAASGPAPTGGRVDAAAAAQASRSAARGTASGPDLTEREAEVLALMAEALSNAEIASKLYIGEATVKTHVSNVLLKLGARDRVQAVVYAHRHGLA